MFQVHLFLLRVVLLILLLPQIIRPGITVRFKKKELRFLYDNETALLVLGEGSQSRHFWNLIILKGQSTF